MADTSYNTDSSFDQNSSAMEEDSGRDTGVSPTSGHYFSFSRASSAGSIYGTGASSASSTQNTDDEDSDSCRTMAYKERRREAHIYAEQKRRDAIKKGYEELQTIVPTCQQTDATAINNTKMSKANVLQKSIDYIQFLSQQKKKQEEDLDSLRKDVMALKIMKLNYERIVKAHQSNPVQGQNHISDEVKFEVFKNMMDNLFDSFDDNVSVSSFERLSDCVFRWLEEHCKPPFSASFRTRRRLVKH